jgi:hypothetical protein
MRFAGLRIDIDLDLVLGAVMGLGRALHGFFHRGDHDRLLDVLVAGNSVRDLQQFCPVGGNSGHCRLLLIALCALSNLPE